MSGVQAQAFLALWNGIASAQVQPEYESWHSFEHVPERVGLPGFVEATRYRSVAQPLRYFTCYSLRSLDALATPEYRDVFTHPTPWSARMRLVLRDFYRLPCEVGGVHGLSSASQLATLQWRSASPPLAASFNRCLQALVLQGAAVRAQWGLAPPGEDYWLPNTANSLQGAGQDHVLMLEHLDAQALRRCVQAVVEFLQPQVSSIAQPEYFELLTHVRQDALDSPPGTRRAPHTQLFDQFNGK
jgi:hypothetical protein